MRSKLLGPILALAMLIAPAAKAAQFIPLTDPENTVLQAVARQLSVGFNSPQWSSKAYLMDSFFSQAGPIPASVDAIYFDTSRAGFVYSMDVFDMAPYVVFFQKQPTDTLPDGNALAPPFITTFQLNAVPSIPGSTIDSTPIGSIPEVLLFQISVDPFKSNEELSAAFSGKGPNPIRIAAHVSAIAGYPGGEATFLMAPPVPEAATWAALLGGLGLLATRARRRQAVPPPSTAI